MRYRLLQARLPSDPVRHEEHAAFAARLQAELADVRTFDLLAGDTSLERVTDGVDAVLVGGSGAFSVLDDAAWLRPFFDTLGALADTGFPTFASCFGFQGMVLALGGRVVHDEPNAEVGSFEVARADAADDDPLFAALPNRFMAQCGHKDRADGLPAGLIGLASSERCPFQAFRVAGKPVWATQFHPELTDADNRRRLERYFAMYSSAFGLDEATRMLEAFRPSPHANALLPRFRDLLAGA